MGLYWFGAYCDRPDQRRRTATDQALYVPEQSFEETPAPSLLGEQHGALDVVGYIEDE